MTNYIDKAISYCDKYGFREFYVKGNTMIYYTSWRIEHTTYKCVVNLDTMEETRTPMKRYYKPHKFVGGKYQVIPNV